jgi:hypothetical protein
MQPLTEQGRRFDERVERDRLVRGIQYAIDLRATGFKTTSKLGLCHLRFIQRVLKFKRIEALDRDGFDFFEQAFFGEEIVNAGTDVRILFHDLQRRNFVRLQAACRIRRFAPRLLTDNTSTPTRWPSAS